jgi:hypothetical protein
MLALVFLLGRPVRGERGRDLALAGGLLALVLLFPANAAFWARLHLTEASARPGGATVAEDRSGVVVMRPGPDATWMAIGGYAQSRLPFTPMHGALGAVGPLVHPEPRAVLTIGHAIGGTPYAALLAAGGGPQARVRSIEIVAPVYEAVRDHAARPDGPAVLRAMLADPRIERVLGDGRHAIFAEQARRWDVIQADALLPRSSHSGLLYSVAFFREVRDSLAPGGIAVQWEPTPRALASFLAAFPHVVRLDAGHGRGAVLLGSPDRPVPFDREALARRLEAVMPALEAASWRAWELRNLLLQSSVQVWGPGDPRPGDVNTDLFPKDEYFLNRWKLDLLGRGAAGR